MRTYLMGLLGVALAAVPGNGRADTLVRDTLPHAAPTQLLTGLGGGVLMLGGGTAAQAAWPGNVAYTAATPGRTRVADAVQYTPLVLPWAFKALGARTRSSWAQMAVAQGIGAGVMAAGVGVLKGSVHAERPDGSGGGSFPSGHTAWAFLGAASMAMETAQTCPWGAVGTYALATAVAVERVADGRHRPADVMAGAGIGLISAGIGYAVGDQIWRRQPRRDWQWRREGNVSFLSVSTGLSLPLGRIRAGATRIDRQPALQAALRGGWAIDSHWGLAMELSLTSTPLITDVDGDRTYAGTATGVSALALPYFSCPLGARVSLTAEVGGGYRHTFGPGLDDEGAVTVGAPSPVARVGAGCVLRLGPHFSAKASVGWEISHCSFTVRPSAAYGIPSLAHASGTSSALLVTLSSRYEF